METAAGLALQDDARDNSAYGPVTAGGYHRRALLGSQRGSVARQLSRLSRRGLRKLDTQLGTLAGVGGLGALQSRFSDGKVDVSKSRAMMEAQQQAAAEMGDRVASAHATAVTAG